MSHKAVANAVGGRTARACDGCVKRRARWYCAADDAFLCQACDASVHSANPVARRHERLRLKTSAPSILKLEEVEAPSWLQGFTRKARTPRQKPATGAKAETLVPDLEGSGDELNNVEEEQLLYRVPIFDPALAEFCSPPPLEEAEPKPASAAAGGGQLHGSVDSLAAFLPSDVDLAEFAANMESLLGRGLDDDDAFCMEGLGLAESRDDENSGYGCCLMENDSDTQVKVEVEDGSGGSGATEVEAEMSRETLEINFDCASPAMEAERKVEMEMEAAGAATGAVYGEETGVSMGRSMTLRLDYEAVIAAWSSSCQGNSPWTDGERPQLNPDDCWPDYTGMWGSGGEVQGGVGGYGLGHGGAAALDGGREARVTRYREKRRTRLFSKKIRYEVRKLNAEKRPRMKGRFVKRASFPATAIAGGLPGVFPY